MAEDTVTQEHHEADSEDTLALPLPSPIEFETHLSIEDCICPICLDYFIDVVETRCHHRFCKYCLENWLRISYRRHCPTCRTNVGPIQTISHLQEAVDSTILPILNSDAILERMRVRNERLAILERMSAEREQEQSLFARISLPIPPYIPRQRSLSESEFGPHAVPASSNLLSRQIMNWWDESSGALLNSEPITPYQSLNDVEIDDMPPHPPPPQSRLSWRLRNQMRVHDALLRERPPIELRALPVEVSNLGIAADGERLRSEHRSRVRTSNNHEDSNNNHIGTSGPIPVNNNSNNNSNNPDIAQLDIMYEESLLEEYAFHLRRSQSAYNRIREGYRDFNYHNTRMQQVFAEHRSFFDRNSTPVIQNEPADTMENEHVDYNDYEDIIDAETRELNNATPVIFSGLGLLPEADIDVETRTRLHHLQNRVLSTLARARTFFRRPESASQNNNRRVSSVDYSERIFPTENPIRETNVIDMEQELQNRRNQLNRIISTPRQFGGPIVNTPRSTATLGRISNPINSGVFRSAQFPLQFHQCVGTNGRLRPTSAQHQLLVDRIRSQSPHSGENQNLVGSGPTSNITSRRMRRRMHRGDVIRRDGNGNANVRPLSPDIIRGNRRATSNLISETENNRSVTVGNSTTSFITNSQNRNNGRRLHHSLTRRDVPTIK